MGGRNSTVRSSLNDKHYDGSDYLVDPELQNGPIFNRRCTDCFCLLIFWIFLIVYGSTCFYAFNESHPDRLLRPVNGDGALCGVGPLKDFPNLYYIIKKSDGAPRAVCIDHCPKEKDDVFVCHGTKRVKQEDCKSKEFYEPYGTFRVLKRFCIPNPDKLPIDFDDDVYDNIIGSFGLDDIQEISEDIVEGQYVFYVTFITCILLTLCYSFLIYKCTGVFVWTSVIATGLSIFVLAYTLQRSHRKNKGSIKQMKAVQQQSFQQGHSDTKDNYQPNDKTQKRIQIAVYVLYAFGILFFISLCCLWKNIKIAIAVLKTTAIIIMRNIRMLFIPFLSSLAVMLWTMFWIPFFILLLASGQIQQPTLGSQYKQIEFNDEQKAYLYVQIFAFFWVMEFIQALFQYAIIVGTCTWYFTSRADEYGHFSLCQGFMWGLRYNQGSLAFGSFLLALVWIIRIILEILDKQMDKVKDENALARCVMTCTKCCLDCFHRFIKFVNENAYIQVALTGESFCISAMQAFILALKNASSFFITNGIGSFLYALGKITISIVNTAIGYLLITYIPEFEEDIDQPLPFLLLIYLMSYMMATSFMQIYGGVSLAILQCLYADVDICQQLGRVPMDNQNRPDEMHEVINLIAREPKKKKDKKGKGDVSKDKKKKKKDQY